MILRVRNATATGPDDPFERDPKLDTQLELSPFPVLDELADDGVFQDIVYHDDRIITFERHADLIFTFDMTGDIEARVNLVARQVYALHGTAGLDRLGTAFSGDPQRRWELRGEGHARPTAEGGVLTWSQDQNAWIPDPDATSALTSHRTRLLDALVPARTAVEAIAKRTCTWMEKNARGFAIHKLIANAAQVHRERLRYFRDDKRAGVELLDLARQWRRIVRGAAELVEAKHDRAMLEVLSAQNATTLAALVVHLAIERDNDAILQAGIGVQLQAEVRFHRIVASAGSVHPVLFKLWEREEVAGRVLAALDAPTDDERIAALRASADLARAMTEVFDETLAHIQEAVTVMRTPEGIELAWGFDPLVKRVRVAGGILEETVEGRAIEERKAHVPKHWLTVVSSAAGLLAFAGLPLAAAVAGIVGLIDLGRTILSMLDGNVVAKAALAPMDSIAAESSFAGMVVVLGIFLLVARWVGERVASWLGAVADAYILVE